MMVLRALTTLRDNRTPDIVRVTGLLGALTFIFLAIFAVTIQGQPYDPFAYGGGFGLMMTALAGAMRFSRRPGDQPPLENKEA
jgi:hypothetical protein